VIFLTPSAFKYRAVASHISGNDSIMAAKMSLAELRNETKPGVDWLVSGWKAKDFRQGDVLKIDLVREMLIG